MANPSYIMDNQPTPLLLTETTASSYILGVELVTETSPPPPPPTTGPTWAEVVLD